jgi:hypothetical protein
MVRALFYIIVSSSLSSIQALKLLFLFVRLFGVFKKNVFPNVPFAK